VTGEGLVEVERRAGAAPAEQPARAQEADDEEGEEAAHHRRTAAQQTAQMAAAPLAAQPTMAKASGHVMA
jgi:hypothetical protein